MINRLIQKFIFDEKIRKDLIFSDDTKLRLNTVDPLFPRIELKADAGGLFPTDLNLYVETPLITPHALQKWLRFEAIFPQDEIPVGTGVKFKIKTATNPYFWNGSAWAIAGPTDWMSAADININFNTFPIAAIGSRSIGFMVNLATTDPTLTPQVTELKFAGEFDIDFLEDIIYDGVVRKLNTEFRSTSQLVFKTNQSSSSIDLALVLENKGYNITGVRKVINLTDDSLKLSNLFQSYTPGNARQDGFTFDPGVITLSAAIPVGKFLEITFEYVPEVIVHTHQDFFEVPSYPSLVLESIDEVDLPGFTSQVTNAQGKDLIRDLSNLTGILQLGPEQKTLRVDFCIYTNLQLDEMRLTQDLSEFFSQNLRVTSYGLARDYDLRVTKKISTVQGRSSGDVGGYRDASGTVMAEGSFDILGVLFFSKSSVDVSLVGLLNNGIIA